MDRRRFHRLTTGLTASAVLGNVFAQDKPASPKVRKKVVIAGGGLAGLCCGYELMERGHDVTILEASRRTGGHVKTMRDPLPDGLYADVGAEHFTRPGYTQYWKYVEKFNLPYLPWNRRQQMYRKIDGSWYTEAQLQEPAVLRAFGFAPREVDHIVERGWAELSSLFLESYLVKSKDEYQPFGIGLDHLDHTLFGDLLAQENPSAAAMRFAGGGRRASPDKPPTSSDTSALFRLWQSAIVRLRGLPNFKREVFHLKNGNQVLPDTFAAKLDDRIRRHCPIIAIEHTGTSVTVHYTDADKASQHLEADALVICIPPILLAGIKVTPDWSEAKAFALKHTVMGMQSRVLLQTKNAFWKGDVPSINLETGDSRMGLVYETADDVPGDSCVLMGSGRPSQTPEETIEAFRKFYPGKNPDTIERCIVHEWWKEEPTCFGCERQAFPLGHLSQIWPQVMEPVGPIHFAGAAYDNLPWGMDAATRTANRVAERIHAM